MFSGAIEREHWHIKILNPQKTCIYCHSSLNEKLKAEKYGVI